MTTQKITDFLNEKKILWFPICLEVDNKTKKLMPIKHDLYQFGCPKYTDFNKEKAKQICLSRQTLLTNPEFKNALKYIAIDTSKIFHIDIDCEEYDKDFDAIAEISPYFKSITKSFGRHIFIKTNEKLEKPRHGFLNSKKQNGFGVELLCGQWSYAPIDAIIHNSNKEFYNYENLKEKIDKKEERKITISTKKNKTTSPLCKSEVKDEKENDKFIDLLFNVIKNEKTPNGEWIISYDIANIKYKEKDICFSKEAIDYKFEFSIKKGLMFHYLTNNEDMVECYSKYMGIYSKNFKESKPLKLSK